MFNTVETYLLYNILALGCPLLCFLSERKQSKYGVYIAYAILILVSVLRYDIGDDYERYASMFTRAAAKEFSTFTILDFLRAEPYVYLVSFLFRWSDYPYFWCQACYSIPTLILFYKFFERYKAHTIGLFVFIVTFSYFQAWDGVRQYLAIAVFAYAVRFIEERKFWRYAMLILLGAMCHYSVFFTLPLYYLGYVKIRPLILTMGLLGLFAMAEVGLVTKVFEKVISFIPYYGQIYSNTSYMQGGGNTFHSSTYILNMSFYISIVYMSKEKHSLLMNFVFLCAVIYGLAGGNLGIMRLSWYFTPLLAVLVSQILTESSSIEEYNNVFVRYIYIFLVLIALFEGVYVKANFRSVVPYETVFSEEFEKKVFRIRGDLVE